MNEVNAKPFTEFVDTFSESIYLNFIIESVGDWEPLGLTDSGVAVEAWEPVEVEANLISSTILVGAVMLSGNITSAGSLKQLMNRGLIL